MPPVNDERRVALADAAVELVGRLGPHGLSHRAVDDAAGVPRGTTSNYYRSREMLLAAALTRVTEWHFEWVTELRAQHPGPMDRDAMVDVLTTVVDQAVTRHRHRYIAMFELFLDSTRRPELAEAVAGISGGAMDITREAHLGGETPSDLQLVLMSVFYNGAVFSSFATPALLGQRSPGEITRAMLDIVLPNGDTRD